MTSRWHKGFTLLEVVVAFAVLSASAAVLYGIARTTLQQTHQAAVREQAVLLAQSRLAAAVADPGLAAHGLSGSERGFDWRVSVRPFSDAQEGASDPWRLILIEVQVEWGSTAASGLVEMTTLGLARQSVGGA